MNIEREDSLKSPIASPLVEILDPLLDTLNHDFIFRGFIRRLEILDWIDPEMSFQGLFTLFTE